MPETIFTAQRLTKIYGSGAAEVLALHDVDLEIAAGEVVVLLGPSGSGIVTLGQRNNQIAQIVSGLSEGDIVVLHPSDRISEGVAVAQREVQ
jgi:ABC-type lipoprotein export system ATPase subunit